MSDLENKFRVMTTKEVFSCLKHNLEIATRFMEHDNKQLESQLAAAIKERDEFKRLYEDYRKGAQVEADEGDVARREVSELKRVIEAHERRLANRNNVIESLKQQLAAQRPAWDVSDRWQLSTRGGCNVLCVINANLLGKKLKPLLVCTDNGYSYGVTELGLCNEEGTNYYDLIPVAQPEQPEAEPVSDIEKVCDEAIAVLQSPTLCTSDLNVPQMLLTLFTLIKPFGKRKGE